METAIKTLTDFVIQGMKNAPVGAPAPVQPGSSWVAAADLARFQASTDLTLAQLRQETLGGGVEIAGHEITCLEDSNVLCSRSFPTPATSASWA